MPIQLTCPSCSRLFHAPDATAGRRAKCPKCGCPIDIPIPIAAEVLDAEPQPVSPFAGNDFKVERPAALPTRDDLKPCPICGEMIQQSAIKCRFCGEVLDPTMKDVLGAAAISADSGWSRVRSGLATIYNCIIIVFIAIIVIIVAGMVMGGFARAQGPGNPPVTMFVVFGIAGLTIVGAGLGMLIGQILCISVPASSGARGFAVGAIFCLLAQVLISMVGGAMNNQAIAALGSLVSIGANILFLLFIRQSAAHLGNPALASSAGKFIIFSIIVFILFFVGGVVSGIPGAQIPTVITFVIAAVAGLVGFVWFMRLVKQFMETIDGRMNVRSIIQEAGSAAMPR